MRTYSPRGRCTCCPSGPSSGITYICLVLELVGTLESVLARHFPSRKHENYLICELHRKCDLIRFNSEAASDILLKWLSTTEARLGSGLRGFIFSRKLGFPLYLDLAIQHHSLSSKNSFVHGPGSS